MKESNVEILIRLAAAKHGCTLFRNNVGVAYQGNSKRLSDGSIHIQNPRILHAGLFKGSGDEIGYTPILITSEMVGKYVAVFTSVEVKSGSKMSLDQITWLNAINSAGGIAGCVKSPDDMIQLLTQFKLNLI